MKNLPSYLLENKELIAIGHEVIGSSKHIVIQRLENQLVITLQKPINYKPTFVILSNAPQKIVFNFEANSMLSMNLNHYYTKKTNKDIDFNFQSSSNVKIVETFLSSIKTTSEITRQFNLSKSSVLSLESGLFMDGTHKITDEIHMGYEDGEFYYNTLYLGAHDDHLLSIQNIRHQAKNTLSLIKNMIVSSNLSDIDFSVNGYIEKGMSGSNCKQQNRGVILNELGSVRVDPKLYIDEYDVEAGHGAAIGQINEDEMFYLLSRGLNELDAKRLILSGYTESFVSSLDEGAFKRYIERRIERKVKGA